MRAIVQNEEWAIFKGSSAVNSYSFDGFDAQLTTNVSDNAGAALSATGVTLPAFDKLIKLIRLQGANRIDGIYLSYGLQNVVNQIVSTAARYAINIDTAGNNITAGDNVTAYASGLGPIPVIGDFFCNASLPYPIDSTGSSGAQGNAVSTVYFLRHDEQGVQMVDLMPVGRTELARIADTIRFYINE